jgi:hypothetical protein
MRAVKKLSASGFSGFWDFHDLVEICWMDNEKIRQN